MYALLFLLVLLFLPLLFPSLQLCLRLVILLPLLLHPLSFFHLFSFFLLLNERFRVMSAWDPEKFHFLQQKIEKMARTIQVTRESVGGKAPRKAKKPQQRLTTSNLSGDEEIWVKKTVRKTAPNLRVSSRENNSSPQQKAPKTKKRRHCPNLNAIHEIQKHQSSTVHLVPKKPFGHLVCSIPHQYCNGSDIRF